MLRARSRTRLVDVPAEQYVQERNPKALGEFLEDARVQGAEDGDSRYDVQQAVQASARPGEIRQNVGKGT